MIHLKVLLQENWAGRKVQTKKIFYLSQDFFWGWLWLHPPWIWKGGEQGGCGREEEAEGREGKKKEEEKRNEKEEEKEEVNEEEEVNAEEEENDEEEKDEEKENIDEKEET